MIPGAKAKLVRPTIQAIAKRAGVSRATVSLILSDRPEVVARFKPETARKVREIADELGYRANLTAISLRSAYPTFFGLVLRGAGSADAISWHHQAFEGQFLAGALEASRLLNLYPVLSTQDSPDPDGALHRVRGVLDGGIFGAIFRTPLPVLDAPMRRQIERGLPVVIVFPEQPASHPSNLIDVDNVAAGRIAAQLLARAGRRRWIIVRHDRLWDAVHLREEGARLVASEVGASVEMLAVPSGIDENGVSAWLAPKFKRAKPDGIYAASSVTGVGSLLACQRAGLRVPEQVSLVGCDASLWRAPGCPGITSVDVSWHATGELAVRKMFELRESGESKFENIKLPPYIRRGESCPGGHEQPARVTSADDLGD